MSVIIEESVCKSCKILSSCKRLDNLNPKSSIRDSLEKERQQVISGGKDFLYKLVKERGRPAEVFEIVIKTCSLKDRYDRRVDEKVINEDNLLYYCSFCNSMHKVGSELGKAHNKYRQG